MNQKTGSENTLSSPQKQITPQLILEKIRSNKWIFSIFLLSLIYILDVRYFSSPSLYGDDWDTIVRRYVFGDLNLVSWYDRRPFIETLFTALTSILGIRLQYFYLVNFLFIFLSAVLLYIIIKQAFPQFSWLPLPVVLLYLIYPVDYSRTLLIMMNNHMVWLIDLGIIFLMMEFAKSGKRWQLILALISFLLSLGAYEGGLGVVMLASVLLASLTRNISVNRRLAFLSVLFVGGIFIMWRTFIQPDLLNIQDPYLARLDTSVITIFIRYIVGVYVFIFSWLRPCLGSLGTKLAAFFLVLIITVVILISLPKLRRFEKSNNAINLQKKTLIKSLLAVFLVGGLFWAAGYIPIISYTSPPFDGPESRLNLFAIAGGSLAFVAGLSILMIFIVKSVDLVRVLTTMVVIPFVAMGLFYQFWSQNERFKVWNEQKEFWNLMFATVPGLQDDTEVIIVIPGYEQLHQFQFLPFRGNWEAESALDVLYNNSSLEAIYYYPDRPHEVPNLLAGDKDWSKVVFVSFDTTLSSLDVLEHPEVELSLPFEVIGYDPWKRVGTQSPESLSYRWLVK